MTIRYDPPRELPPGQHRYMDVVREIEAAEDLKATGWHYACEPDADEIAYKSRVHHGGSELVAREVVTGAETSSWTLFERAPT